MNTPVSNTSAKTSVTASLWIQRILPFLSWIGELRDGKVLRADLIVIDSHGHAGLQRALLGSVSERVNDAVSTPVLVAKIS